MDPNVYRRMAEIQATHWWYAGRRHILRSVIARLPLKHPARILEVGCGTGANLGMLQEFGAVEGVEPDAFARECAVRLSGCRIDDGLLPDGLKVTGLFDLICALDVIEHVEEDGESLTALARLLSPGGTAIFTVPAFRFMWSRHDEINHHYHRYTRSQFGAKLDRAGFETIFLSYYNMFLFPLIVAVRFLKRFLHLRDRPDEALAPAPVNACLRAVFCAEAPLLKITRLPFGVSIIAICRRRP